ncbi:GH36 C-terminal domain-containing protein [Acerihabitans arboris]|uniref:GH36 C-terminal domain-containing protein n=1 Tax=Acerihabitans arboris TaxID=2691583 RepID=UPI001FE50280|nr:GH36 C-terminal domain-containing protein [Acerihabitans arboris]
MHKRLRPLLHGGRAFRLDANQPDQPILGVVADDQTEAVVLICQRQLPEYALSGNLRIPYLNPVGRYRLEILDMPQSFHQPRNHTMKRYPAWFDSQCVLSGEWLEKVGFALPVLDPESALLLFRQE